MPADPPEAAFQPLGDYDYPPMPADDVARGALARLRRLFVEPDATASADTRLKRAARGLLDEVVPAPASGPLARDLEDAFGAWGRDGSGPAIQVVVLPPCDHAGILARWAKSSGHALLTPPARAELADSTRLPPPDLAGEGLLVVPALDHWFLRTRLGLGAVRALLGRVAAGERKCLLGCGSFAWAFLSRAVEADALLPHPLSMRAYDAERLRNWFAELAAHGDAEATLFRFSDGGHEIDLAARQPQADNYFKRLASRSLGIPWVAWHQWRQSLRSRADTDPAGPQTLWVGELETYALPSRHEPDELLLLQALLIHGSLGADGLRETVPSVRAAGVVPALVGAGLVERCEGEYRCRPAAYPAVRAGLSAAGFPLDEL